MKRIQKARRVNPVSVQCLVRNLVYQKKQNSSDDQCSHCSQWSGTYMRPKE